MRTHPVELTCMYVFLLNWPVRRWLKGVLVNKEKGHLIIVTLDLMASNLGLRLIAFFCVFMWSIYHGKGMMVFIFTFFFFFFICWGGGVVLACFGGFWVVNLIMYFECLNLAWEKWKFVIGTSYWRSKSIKMKVLRLKWPASNFKHIGVGPTIILSIWYFKSLAQSQSSFNSYWSKV